RFPRSSWVPDDGIQPLNGGPSSGNDSPGESDRGNDGAEHPAGSPAIEAGDFWASGETQEFVGVVSAGSPALDAQGSESRPVRTAEPRQRLLRAPVMVA